MDGDGYALSLGLVCNPQDEIMPGERNRNQRFRFAFHIERCFTVYQVLEANLQHELERASSPI